MWNCRNVHLRHVFDPFACNDPFSTYFLRDMFMTWFMSTVTCIHMHPNFWSQCQNPPDEAIVATTSPRNVNPSAQLKRLKALQPTDRVPAMDVDPSKRHRLVNVTWWKKTYIYMFRKLMDVNPVRLDLETPPASSIAILCHMSQNVGKWFWGFQDLCWIHTFPDPKQGNEECTVFGSCCHDYAATCAKYATCKAYGCGTYRKFYVCQWHMAKAGVWFDDLISWFSAFWCWWMKGSVEPKLGALLRLRHSGMTKLQLFCNIQVIYRNMVLLSTTTKNHRGQWKASLQAAHFP